jgi:hypothetical protein
MTDLEASQEDRGAHGRADIHAAGTPGGGTAVGGLAGTNIGDGSPDDVDLEDALGSGIHDQDNEEEEEAYSGPSGGAVGGTPANRRETGGRSRHGIAPGGERPGDSTIGNVS